MHWEKGKKKSCSLCDYIYTPQARHNDSTVISTQLPRNKKSNMETLVQLLWISLATIVFVAILRRSTKHAPYSPILPTVKISDPAIAQRLLFDHADAFSNRPTRAFPLDFSGGRYHGISTTPYGPVWRILRRGLTADILHPTRLSLQEPLQREAV